MNPIPFNKHDNVVAYCRYSAGDEQGLRNVSTEEQKEAITRFCQENELNLTAVFEDPFVSGRSVQGREHYLEMLSFLLKKKKPDIAGVILWDYERYGRNYDQAQLDTARLRMAGYKLYSMQQPINDDSPFARVLESMYFASAQNQSDMISADVKRALHSNFEKYHVIPRTNVPKGWDFETVDMGYYSDGKPRIGYRPKPSVDLKERIIKAISLRFKGGSLGEMREIMGKEYSTTDIKNLMKKPILYGAVSYGGSFIEDFCDPIISKETFQDLQIYNAACPHKTKRKGSGAWSKDRALLSGMLYCGICGLPAYILRRKARGKIYETYYCDEYHVGIRKEILDDLVITAALDLLSDKNFYENKRKVLETSENPFPKNDPAVIMNRISEIDKQTESITEAIATIGNSRSLLLKLQSLEEERKTLETELNSSGDNKENVSELIDRIRNYCIETLQTEKDTDTLRSVLQTFILSVHIYPDNMVKLKHTMPGLLGVVSQSIHKVYAPPNGKYIILQFIATYQYKNGCVKQISL